MIKTLCGCFLLLTLVSATLVSRAAEIIAAPEMPRGHRFKEILAEKFPDGRFTLGAATGLGPEYAKELVILDREFPYVTPANDFKPTAAAYNLGKELNFTKADAWLAHARMTHQVLRAHAPIGPQCTKWTKEPARTPAELHQALVEFATAMWSHCNAATEVKWLDVVNETVEDNGSWFGPKSRVEAWQNPWTKIGTDPESKLHAPVYIREAFEIANKVAPDKKLVYNQHRLTRQSWDKVRDVIEYLQGRGLRVDGFGWQAHIDVGWDKTPGNMNLLAEVIDWCHARRMAFHITEMNVFLERGWERTEVDWQAQADTFRNIVKMLMEKSAAGEVSCNFWGLTDGRHGTTHSAGKDGCLFDAEGRAKPAYYAIQELLERHTTAR